MVDENLVRVTKAGRCPTLILHKVVRRIALSSLNSAARTKPHIVKDHLVQLLPNLYKETKVKPELIRTVQMGPWTQKFDDGLETRKTAYETMYTLVGACNCEASEPCGVLFNSVLNSSSTHVFPS